MAHFFLYCILINKEIKRNRKRKISQKHIIHIFFIEFPKCSKESSKEYLLSFL
jgi:hypothetical protein